MNRSPAMPAVAAMKADEAAASVGVEPDNGAAMATVLRAAVAALDEVPGVLHELSDAQLDELLTVLSRLHSRSAQIVTGVLSDAAVPPASPTNPSAELDRRT